MRLNSCDEKNMTAARLLLPILACWRKGTFLLLLAGMQALSVAQAAEPRVLRFVTYANERPSEELKKMEPFQHELQLLLRNYGIRMRIEVRIHPTYEAGQAALAAGEFDFARVGPVSYVLTKQKRPKIQLLLSEAHEGRKQFSGVIVVAENSPLQTLADLRGKRIAFGDQTSTTGRYLPQAELVRAGIRATDLEGFDYLGRHDKVAFAVASGSHDAGAISEPTFVKYAGDRKLRELARFASPTQAWVARDGLDPAIVKALRSVLLQMSGEGLRYIGRSGFVESSDADYDSLRKQMQVADKFGG